MKKGNPKHESASDSPLDELAGWLEELPDNDRAEIEQTWSLAEMGREGEPGASEVADAWAKLDAASGAHDRPPARPRLRLLPRRMVYAAAVILMLASVGTWWWMGSVTLEGLAGQSTRFVLPDGSAVELASGARLTHRRGFRGGTRSTRLEGEGFFEVASSATSFTVETFNASVAVLGTRFNVRAWETDIEPQTTVTLEEGSVRLAPLGWAENTLTLSPGQTSHILAGATHATDPYPAQLARALAWREGGFSFDDLPLQSIVEEIERRYGVSIDLPLEMRDRKLVLFHDRPENAEILLDAISAVSGYRYRVTRQGFEFLPGSN